VRGLTPAGNDERAKHDAGGRREEGLLRLVPGGQRVGRLHARARARRGGDGFVLRARRAGPHQRHRDPPSSQPGSWPARGGIEPTSDGRAARQKDLKPSGTTRSHSFPHADGARLTHTRSISTRAPRGSPCTATVERAGRAPLIASPYTWFTSWKSAMSARKIV